MIKFFTPLVGAWLALATIGLGSDLMPPLLSSSSAPATGRDALLPTNLDPGRFSALGRKSPFTLASTIGETADFAKDLVLAGYVRLDGEDLVMVANRTRPERLLVGTKPSASGQGMVLLKVERDPSGDPGKLKAQIRKGSETATLKYEVTSPGGAVPPGQPQPVQGQPTAPGQPVPAQAQTQAQPVPGQPASQNPPVIRRRVVPVPSLPGR
ncbi:MAG: hypothetical protein EBT68_02925 [Verrucomicrobia bacterium]|nr:hypothetical protein [Verrucomicrobiota bacterium]